MSHEHGKAQGLTPQAPDTGTQASGPGPQAPDTGTPASGPRPQASDANAQTADPGPQAFGRELSRRELFRLGAATAAASSLAIGLSARSTAARAVRQASQAAPAFFTPAEFALVDELSEIIIPTDGHSPGARAAKVAAFIDFQLAEAWEEKERTDWRDGLALVERLSQQTSGKQFLQAPADQRVALLTQMAKGEAQPQKPEEEFFKELKSRVVYAYYTSEIGIKQEMEYKGNSYLTEFAGTDVSKSGD